MTTQTIASIAKDVPELSYSLSWTTQAIDYRNGPKSQTEVSLGSKVVSGLSFVALILISLVESLARLFFALLLVPMLIYRCIDKEAYKMNLCGAVLALANAATCLAACIYNCTQGKLDYDALLPSAETCAFSLLKTIGIKV